MHSSSLKMIASFIFHVFWIVQQREVLSIYCINFPKSPLHGSLKIHGKFILRITCNSSNTDLPLNAPGEGGVLVCDPNKMERGYLPNVKAPYCLTRKEPSTVFMPIRLTYLSKTCSESFTSKTERTLTQLRNYNLQSLKEICGKNLSCNLTKISLQCSSNRNFMNDTLPQQLDVTFNVQAPYVNTLSIRQYLTVLENIRRHRFATDRGLEGTNKLWSVEGLKMVQAEVSSWRASCTEHRNTHGTNLAIHKIASCRGCPVSTVFDQWRNNCLPCPYDHYTKEPFSAKCEKCPPENQWDDKFKWITLCYVRV